MNTRIKLYVFYEDDSAIGLRALGVSSEDYFVMKGSITIVAHATNERTTLNGKLGDRLITKLLACLDPEDAFEVSDIYNK